MMKRLQKTLRLSFSLAKTDFKLKNEGSLLGMFWYLLEPILLLSLLYIIFSQSLGGQIENYPLYLLLGLIIFNFFSHATTEATGAIVNNAELIKSSNFPREALVISIVIKRLYSHLFEILIFAGFLIFLGADPIWLLFYPIILFFLILFVLGLSLLLSVINIYFIDMANIWGFACQLLWFATPIFYSDKFPLPFYSFNPLAYFISISRKIIIYHQIPAIKLVAIIIIGSLFSVLVGFYLFNLFKKDFAENI